MGRGTADDRYWKLNCSNSPSTTNDWVHEENFSIDKHLAAGNNIPNPPSPRKVAHFCEIVDTQYNEFMGVHNVIRHDVPYETNKWCFCLKFELINNSTGTTFRDAGILGYVRNATSGDVIKAYGAQGGVRNEGSGTITNAVGIQGTCLNIGSGEITNAFGVSDYNNITDGLIVTYYSHFADNLNVSGSGAVTTHYQFYAKDTSAATNNYGFYQNGTNVTNYFNNGLQLDGPLEMKNTNEVRFYDNGNYVGFEAPALSADQIWVLPTADGSASQVLQTNGSGTLSWGDKTTNTDEKVKVDTGATADYLGANANDGALRATVTNGLTWTDGGNYVTLGFDADYADISGNDGATDVTAAELEELTDGSQTTLHSHAADTHNILSSTHSDTLADTVVRGDVIIGNATPKWSRLAIGTSGYFLKSDGTDAAWTAHGLTYTDIKRTDCVVYMDVKAADDDGILASRSYRNESVTVFAFQIDVPRQVTVSTIPLMSTMTGTVTINGIDADGAALSVDITINDSSNTTHTTDEAFARVSSVVVTSAGGTGNYKVGWNDTLGLPNYPWQASTDLFKLKKGTADVPTTTFTINATYGTIKIDDYAVIALGDDYTFWYRPYK